MVTITLPPSEHVYYIPAHSQSVIYPKLQKKTCSEVAQEGRVRF